MTTIDYLNKLEDICKHEFMSATELVRELNIAHNTLIRIRRFPETCSMQTMRKIKLFVDKWISNNPGANMSETH